MAYDRADGRQLTPEQRPAVPSTPGTGLPRATGAPLVKGTVGHLQVRFTCRHGRRPVHVPRRPLSIVFALLLSVALAGEVQADGANGDSAASLSIRGVNVKVVNSSACSIETRIGISSRYVTKTLAPGDSVQFAGSGLPVLSNVTGAAIVSTPDCKQSVSAEGIFTNPQIGELQ